MGPGPARRGRVVAVSPARACEVLIDGRWWHGHLTSWELRDDGTWWGEGFAEWRDWTEPKRYPDQLRPVHREPDRSGPRTPETSRKYNPPRPVQVRIDGRWLPGELTEAYRAKTGEWWGWGHARRGRWNRWVPADRIRARRRSASPDEQ